MNGALWKETPIERPNKTSTDEQRLTRFVYATAQRKE